MLTMESKAMDSWELQGIEMGCSSDLLWHNHYNLSDINEEPFYYAPVGQEFRPEQGYLSQSVP